MTLEEGKLEVLASCFSKELSDEAFFSPLVWCDLFTAMATAVSKREKDKIAPQLFHDTYYMIFLNQILCGQGI